MLDNLFKITESVSNGFNNKKMTIGVFLDVEKAFDRVWHAGLLNKLKKLKMKPYLIRWIASFLSDRTIYIKTGNSFSDPFSPLFGVPQGSPLSPILFIIYVSDIYKPTNTSKVNQSMFADDLSLRRTVTRDYSS